MIVGSKTWRNLCRRGASRTSVACLLLFVLCVLGCSTTVPYRNYIGSWSPDGKRILFYSDRSGNWDIYMINEDGSGLKTVVSTVGADTEPCWHPDGSSFVFVSDVDSRTVIHRFDFSAGTTTVLNGISGSHRSPAWAPDGERLAFLNKIDSLWHVVVFDARDSSHQTLYSGVTYPGRPTWRSDSERVLYSVAVDGVETIHLASVKGDPAVMFTAGYNSIGNASVSPDGKTMVFDAHEYDSLESGDGRWEIFTYSIDDRSVQRLTKNSRDDWGARWSPDGKKILFLGNGLNNAGYELHVMDATGENRRQVTFGNR